MPTEIFVFGSNLAGRHGKGAALYAKKYYNAIYGQGEGYQGRSYAIPTKDENLKPRRLQDVSESVRTFITFVNKCRILGYDFIFTITPVGCGLAGFRPDQIAPMFIPLKEVPCCVLPKEFLEVL